MAKQDKSKFQLNKGTDHGFDISKGGKRKFDLTKDDDDLIVASAPSPQPKVSANHVTPTLEPEEKKNNKWFLIILSIIIIILLIWWLLPGKSNESKPVVEEETIEEVAPVVENAEEVSEEAAIPVEGDAVEDKVESDESNTPSEPLANTPKTDPVHTAPQATKDTAPNSVPTVVSNDVEAEALKVIRGDYGIGEERKSKLGNQYDAIQKRVNELKKEGIF